MSQQQIVQFLKILTCSVFLGRAWQHIFWDIPLRELLWREEWIARPVKVLPGMEWETYISSTAVDVWIVRLVVVVGFFYILCAIAAVFLNKNRKWLRYFISIGAIGLVFLGLLYWLEKFQNVGQFIEYTLQFGTPIFLVWSIFYPPKHLIFTMKIAIALTFIGHGLYALGFYPVPAHFVQMLIDGFGINETIALKFLQIVGILDLVAAVLIFLPNLWIAQSALFYCIIWGSATAFARIIANFDAQIPLESFHRWLYEVVYRLPHGGIPLMVFLYYFRAKNRR